MRLLQLGEVVLTNIHRLVKLMVGVFKDPQLKVAVPYGNSVKLLLDLA